MPVEPHTDHRKTAQPRMHPWVLEMSVFIIFLFFSTLRYFLKYIAGNVLFWKLTGMCDKIYITGS